MVIAGGGVGVGGGGGGCGVVFFFNDTATTEIYTLSLHDALPIYLYQKATLEREKTLKTIRSAALTDKAQVWTGIFSR